MDIQIFTDLFNIGLHPIPLIWDSKTKQATGYPEHKTDIQSKDGKPDMVDITRWFDKLKNANAIALKLYPPFGMLDFDLKNDKRKGIYDGWLDIVSAKNEGVLKKVCIEKTRSGGYHVYIKFKGLDNKKMLAISEDKKEVISVYTGGLLSFCAPTPDYNIIHNDFTDLEELTQDEFDLLCTAAADFNIYDDSILSHEQKVITYPIEYENEALQFDKNCTDELFESLLNSIDLFEVKNKRLSKTQKHLPYLRKGSVAAYSAKVYFKSKKVLLFSGSYVEFPNYHTKINENDPAWILTPTKLIYYKNKRNWIETIEIINHLSEQFDLPKTEKSKPNEIKRTDFPYDIFPEIIQQFIFSQSIQHEYLAGAILGAISASIGNTATLEAMPGYQLKAILYMAIVAPPGAAKTPAVKKAFQPLEEIDNISYKNYTVLFEKYESDLAEWEQNKKKNGKRPKEPQYKQVLIKDSTIEMVSKILSINTDGCCILADELSGFLNRMNQYKAGDEEQKWLELWSGSPILNQRISTGVKKIEDPFCSIVGGIQPGVLEILSKEDKQHNGFYHRFIFVYPDQQPKQDWKQITVQGQILEGFTKLFFDLNFYKESEKTIYYLSEKANILYKQWFDYKNIKYNKAFTDNIKGIIAKYQDYCLRFALIIQIIHDGVNRQAIIEPQAMERAIRLTEYFLFNMHKACRILTPETPLDKMQENYKLMYDKLSPNFTTATFIQHCESFGIKSASAKNFLLREQGKLVVKLERNTYEKIF
jgi:hypothetical protein